MQDNKKIIATLNELIEICNDGEAGYRLAAEEVKDEELKSLFAEYSSQRAGFISELQEEVERLDGKPATKGSATGAAHRGWMKLKDAVSGDEDSAIISEAERGEDAAKETYERALDQDMPSDLLSVVERQYTDIKEAHDRVRKLETALS